MRFVFAADAWEGLRDTLLANRNVETCAIVWARERAGRLIVHQVRLAKDEDYADRTALSAQLRPEFLFDAAATARQSGSALIFVHTHPQEQGTPVFSAVDDAGEARLKHFLDSRVQQLHGAIVLAPGGVAARVLGTGAPAHVLSVGAKVRRETEGVEDGGDERFDRQVRAFGAEGQAAIAALKIGIVGLGGTGSLTAQQLAYLGVRDFALVDFDPVDATSLNRLVNATAADVGRPKVEVAGRAILSVRPDAIVRNVVGDVIEDAVARELLDRDLIFGCTDSHASRAILGQIAYQYLIPLIDMGVSISVRGGALAKVTGRAQLLAPGRPCFTCLDLLDSEQIRREMLTPEQRAADRYIPGVQEPQPSVISLNATMSSLATTMFLGVVTEAAVGGTFLRYDGVRGIVRPVEGPIDPACYVCSATGGMARGDTWPLPTRKPSR